MYAYCLGGHHPAAHPRPDHRSVRRPLLEPGLVRAPAVASRVGPDAIDRATVPILPGGARKP
jgi:hypothetical protein